MTNPVDVEERAKNLEILATWFDLQDEKSGYIQSDEVQRDLRHTARLLRLLIAEHEFGISMEISDEEGSIYDYWIASQAAVEAALQEQEK